MTYGHADAGEGNPFDPAAWLAVASLVGEIGAQPLARVRVSVKKLRQRCRRLCPFVPRAACPSHPVAARLDLAACIPE